MRLTRPTICIVFLAFLLTSCDGVGSGPTESPRELTKTEQQVVESNGEFGLKLFRAISENEQKNVIISPLSVSMALGMTLNGAEGETREAMEATLELAGLSREEINRSYQSLLELLATLDPAVNFNLANSIWYRDTFEVEPDFIETNKTFFNAEVHGLDFGSSETPGIINGWVDDKTNGKINKIINGPIPPLTMMYLVNALYFKGDWRYQFDPDETRQAPFTLEGGDEVSVEMMALESITLPVYGDEHLTAIDLPYGDSLYSMTVLLPSEDESVHALAAQLDRAQWAKVVDGLSPRKLDYFDMPRFELRYKIKLNDALKALGMEVAFDGGQANFEGISREANLSIDKVLHKTYVKVNEVGTEAAAVTVVEMDRTSVQDGMRINRPFIFVIRENHSGTILFIGKVTDPRPPAI